MTHEQAVDSMAAERYLLDEMTELERHRFEEHYFDCTDCADEVRLGAVLREEVRAVGPAAAAEPQQTLRFAPAKSRSLFTVVLPWAAAAALAIVAGYQTLFVVPDLRGLLTARAISPVVLHQTTRGTSTTIAVSNSDGWVSLAPDFDTRGITAPIPYTLRRADGTEVFSKRTDASPAGLPLNVLVPARDIRQPGEYVLIIDTGGTPEEYHFQVTAR